MAIQTAVRRWRSLLFLATLCGSAAACPGCPTEYVTPSTNLSVAFRVEPSETQVITAGGSVTYRIVVIEKGVLNAGVEFEALNVPSGLTVTLADPRLAETARETQMTVRTLPSTRPGDHAIEVRARLSVGGQGAPVWYQPTSGRLSVRVTGGSPAFDLTCDDTTLEMRGGDERNTTCLVRRDTGFTAGIDFAFGAKPSYLTVSPDPVTLPPSADTVTFRVQRQRLVPTPASVDLVLNASGAGTSRQHTYRVNLPADLPTTSFEIVCDGELAIPAGGARTLTCRTFRSEGFTTPIEFSFAPHPSYLTIYNETATAGPAQASVEFSVVRALNAATPAFYDLEVIARAFPFERRTRVRVHFPGS